MGESEHMVCVAINDNNRAWYEMLVPFLLSLRQTDYRGNIAVIGYGLSALKRQILESQAITVVEASTTYALPVGRFVEAAQLCARNPQIRKLALYDADIWFCAPHLDLFSNISGDKIFACPDPLFCSFVVSPLMGERRDEHWRLVVDEVKARHAGALQAGLVAGTAEAWMQYAHHLRDCVTRIGVDFQEIFGIDTTFLHLWAAHDNVAQLDCVQNFVIKNGIHESFNESDGSTTLEHLGKPIRALHMTGDIRFFDRWRFYIHDVEFALREGANFALSDGVLTPSDQFAEHASASRFLQSVGLTLSASSMETCAGSYLQVVDEPGGAMLIGSGNHEIAFKATRDMPRLQVYITHPSGSPSPLRCDVEIDGHTFRKGKDLMTHFWHPISAGTVIVLRSTSLGGQLCNAIWRLRDAPEIQQ